MMKTHNGSPISGPSPKPRQHRNREVSSRFLSSSSSPSSLTTTSTESSECHSPSSSVQRKSTSPSDNNNNRRHKITTQDPSLTRHQLWPSSAKKNSTTTTLADHITEDRVIEQKEKPTTNTNKTSSINVYNEIGGSMRYTGRFASTRDLSSSSSSKKLHIGSNGSVAVSGRLSLDENAKSLSSSSSRRNTNSNLANSFDLESHFGDGDGRKAGVEVPSRFMSDVTSRRARRGASDSNIGNVVNSDNRDSSVLLKTAIKRVNSLKGYKSSSSKSQWALSPGTGRSEFSSPTTKVKGVEKFLNFGFDLFKSKKPVVLNSPPVVGFGGNSEFVHQLRLLDNRLIQCRYANARAQVVNANISHKARSNLICAWDGLTKLRHAVLRKKIQFAREKHEMKIAFVLYHQMRLLEAWGGMERQHALAINATKQCLHSVVCRVPLLEGAKVNIPLTSIAMRQASDLTASIKSILTSFSPMLVDKTAAMLSELAKVVAHEKQLLEEFNDFFQTISVFELQERSMKCNLVQLEGWQRKYRLQQLPPDVTS